MAESWPLALKPTSVGFWFENPSVSGGPAWDGSEQTAVSMSLRWRARIRVPIRTDQHVVSARVMFAKLQGRANSLLVPFFDARRQSWPRQIHNGGETGIILHPGVTRDKRLDGTIYEDPAIPTASEINATVNAGVAKGVTQIAILITQGHSIAAGQYFGIGNHLYLITGLVSASFPSGNILQTVNFLPPLRAAAAGGATVKFTRPVCTMKQMSDEQGLQDLDLLRFADLTLEFREVIA